MTAPDIVRQNAMPETPRTVAEKFRVLDRLREMQQMLKRATGRA